MIPKASYYRKMFFIGAIWNWAATLSFALGYKMIFPLFGMKPPVYPVFFLLFLALAFLFGVGYFWVSLDLGQNHAIVKLGIVGKIVVFVGLTWAALAGNISLLLIGPGVVDLIFAILFIEFLASYKKYR